MPYLVTNEKKMFKILPTNNTTFPIDKKNYGQSIWKKHGNKYKSMKVQMRVRIERFILRILLLRQKN